MGRFGRYLAMVALSTILTAYGCERKAPEESSVPDETPAVSLQEYPPIGPYAGSDDQERPDYRKTIWNFFAPAGVETDMGNQQEEDTEESVPRPELRLVGTVAGDDAGDIGYAIIEYRAEGSATKKQGFYQVGDIVGDNAEGPRIESIWRNKAGILYDGQLEELRLYTSTGGSAPVEKRAERAIDQIPNIADVVRVVSTTERDIDGDFFRRVGGVGAIYGILNKSSYVVNEEEEGLRITGLGDGSIAGYIGLNEGDVIRAINGQGLTDNRRGLADNGQKSTAAKQKALQILRKQLNQESASLSIQYFRDNKLHELKFAIN